MYGKHRGGRVVIVGLAVLLITTPLSVGGAFAQTDNGADGKVTADKSTDADKVRKMIKKLNHHGDDANSGPAVKSLAGNTVNLYATNAESGETTVFSFRINSTRTIKNVSEGENPNADLKMVMSMSTVKRISNADKPWASFRSAYANDKISVQPTNREQKGSQLVGHQTKATLF